MSIKLNEWNFKKIDELDARTLHLLLKNRVEVFVVEQACPYQEVDDNDLTCIHQFLLDDDLNLKAYLRIIDTPEVVKFGRVLTSSKYRGTGIGNDLLIQAKEYAIKHYGKKSIYIEAQTYAIPYYEKHGFKVISDIFLDDDIPHVKMQLDY